MWGQYYNVLSYLRGRAKHFSNITPNLVLLHTLYRKLLPENISVWLDEVCQVVLLYGMMSAPFEPSVIRKQFALHQMIFSLHFLFLVEEFFSNKVENTCFLQLTVTITFAKRIHLLCSYKRVYLYVYCTTGFSEKTCSVVWQCTYFHKMVKVKKKM